MNDITLIHGDCLEEMKKIPDKSIDLVLTDPPYGIGRDKGFEGFKGFGGFREKIARRRFEDGNWDKERPHKNYFDEMLRLSKLAIIFGGNFFADILPQGTHWLFWDKCQTMPTFSDGELLWTNSDRKSVKKIRRQYNGLLGKEEERHHPTQKPTDLIKWILEQYSIGGGVVLDPFMGSGTTGVACKMLGRKFIGIEIDKTYFEIAKKRIENTQKELFV
jgi:DNA modification methylase